MRGTRVAPNRPGRVKGDVIEILTRSGFAYAQVSRSHPEFGYLIRVLPGIHARRPDVADLAKGSHVWSTFYPVDESRKRGDALPRVFVDRRELRKLLVVNKINSIAASNPKYADAIRRGTELLKQVGYPLPP